MTRLRCVGCAKTVSTEVPDETIVRAVIVCPECYAAESERLNRIGAHLETLRVGIGTEPVRPALGTEASGAQPEGG